MNYYLESLPAIILAELLVVLILVYNKSTCHLVKVLAISSALHVIVPNSQVLILDNIFSLTFEVHTPFHAQCAKLNETSFLLRHAIPDINLFTAQEIRCF